MNETDYSKYTVLVVDDIPVNILLVKGMLSRFKFNIMSAGSGRQALELMARTRPDIVLMDVMMPDMNGFDTTRAIRANPATSQVPVIILSALNSDADIKEGLEAGANDFITKPFIQERIVNSIVNQITLSESQKQKEVEMAEAGTALEALFRLAARAVCLPDDGFVHRLCNLALCVPPAWMDAELFRLEDRSEAALSAWAVNRIRGKKLKKVSVELTGTVQRLIGILLPAIGHRIDFGHEGVEAGLAIQTDAELFRSLLANLLLCASRVSQGNVQVKLGMEGGVVSLLVLCPAIAGTLPEFGWTLANEVAARLEGTIVCDDSDGKLALHLLMQL